MRSHLVLISLLLLAACGGRVEESRSFVDSDVDVGPNAGKPEPVETPQWATLSSGEFESLEYETTGTINLLEKDSLRILEFETFATTEAPDLRVYLSRDGSLANAVDLGKLESSSGYQTYGVPGFVDLDEYSYVLVHCRAYSVMFGQAQLQ